MGIFGLETAGVLNDDQIAKGPIAGRPGNSAVAGGTHRGSGRRGIIGAFVSANSVQYRVAAIGVEIRAYSEKLRTFFSVPVDEYLGITQKPKGRY